MSFSALTINAWLRIDAINRGLETAAPRTVLEVGPGLGAMACRLAEKYDYTGVELDPVACEVLRRRLDTAGRGVVLLGTTDLLRGQTYDLICAFEVLEHIEDDVSALESWNSLLTESGYLLFSVPAHADKFGPLDIHVGHYRRYERADLEQKLAQAGFEVARFTIYGMLLGALLNIASNLIARRPLNTRSKQEATGESARFLQPQTATGGFIRWSLALPFRVIQRLFDRSDFGTGYVVLARRAFPLNTVRESPNAIGGNRKGSN